MARKRKPTEAELIRRLIAVKMMVEGMKGAMPSVAAELRREATESLEDMIEDLTQ